MNLRLTISPEAVRDAMPPDRELLDAAARGLVVAVRRHLREKNSRTQPKNGFPKSNYYAEAGDTARGSVEGGAAVVEVGPDDPNGPGSGIALHYYGGTVLPKKKALAIPISPAVAGIWPSEAVGEAGAEAFSMIWPKGKNHGFIKDNERNELLWLLVPKATIPADPDVLPTDDEMLSAAERAVMSVIGGAA